MTPMTIEQFYAFVRDYQLMGNTISPDVIDSWAHLIPTGYTVGVVGELEITLPGVVVGVGIELSAGYLRGSNGERLWVGQVGDILEFGNVGTTPLSGEVAVIIARGTPSNSLGAALQVEGSFGWGIGVTVPRDAALEWWNNGGPNPFGVDFSDPRTLLNFFG